MRAARSTRRVRRRESLTTGRLASHWKKVKLGPSSTNWVVGYRPPTRGQHRIANGHLLTYLPADGEDSHVQWKSGRSGRLSVVYSERERTGASSDRLLLQIIIPERPEERDGRGDDRY